jgi:energy-converting hydrogenase Eha subunit F
MATLGVLQYVGVLRPHTYQPSPSIPRSRPGLTALAYNAPLANPGCRRAVTSLVPTIASMGDPVSGRVRGKVHAWLHSGTRFIGYHIS